MIEHPTPRSTADNPMRLEEKMKPFVAKALVVAAVLASAAEAVHAADVDNMLRECQVRASAIFGTELYAVKVKYEGQRTDKTHAVNGSVFVRGRHETFQCNFEPDGFEWRQFIVNFPER
jgi:hypothetical protein